MSKSTNDLVLKSIDQLTSKDQLSVKVFQKGQKVQVLGNSLMEMMGFKLVSGVIFQVTKKSITLQCEQTGLLELIDYDDGEILITG